MSRTLSLMAVLFLFSTIFLALSHECLAQHQVNSIDYYEIIDQLDLEAIKGHLKFFSGLPTRMTGYPSCDAAAKYIYDYFSETLNLVNVSYHLFNVTFPMDYGAWLTLNGKNLTIHPLMPNSVSPVITPPEGIEGPLVYVGRGSLEDLDGKQINGSIVLMDFESEWNWINAARFGAKAVIFIEPSHTTFNYEVRSKTLNIPFNFPRFYIRQDVLQQLGDVLSISQELPTVRVFSNMKWETCVGKNVLGYLRGEPNTNQIIILSAHYDSSSVVPSVAPGANQATSIALLLELARLFKANHPKYTILFVAYAGHNQGIMGGRQFAEDYFFPTLKNYLGAYVSAKHADIGSKVILQIDLQISTQNDQMIIENWWEKFYLPHYLLSSSGAEFDIIDYIKNIFNTVSQATGKHYVIYNAATASWGYAFEEILRYMPNAVPSSETACLGHNGGPAIYFTTVYDTRNFENNPTDTYETLDFNNLKHQAEAIWSSVYTIATNENLVTTYLSHESFKRVTDPQKEPHPTFIRGRVAMYDDIIGWYVPIPKDEGKILVQILSPGGLTFVIPADDKGLFETPCLVPIGGGTGASAWAVQAYVLNETSGNILYAPDRGQHQFEDGATNAGSLGFFNVFKCATTVIFDTVNPQNLIPIGISYPIYRLEPVWSPPLRVVTPGDFSTPIAFGCEMQQGGSVALFYTEPDMPFGFIFGLGRIPTGVLINASELNPLGSGYSFKAGTQNIIYPTTLKFAENMMWINGERHGLLLSLAIPVPQQFLKAKMLVEEAYRSFAENNYSRSYFLSIEAWRLLVTDYIDLRDAIEDTTSTVPIIAFLLIPFVFLTERLFFGAMIRGPKRVFTLIGIFSTTFIIFLLMHPGFNLISSALMAIVGISILILLQPIVGIIFNMFMESVSRLAIKIGGIHFTEVSRGSVVINAFTTGVENLRRHKLRTALTLSTIGPIMLALLLFISFSSIRISESTIRNVTPNYEGIYVRPQEWGGQLGENVLTFLKTSYGTNAKISPRYWLYATPGRLTAANTYIVQYGSKNFTFFAALGLSENEPPSIYESSLIVGRWFLPTDKQACILTSWQAEKLGVADAFEKVSLVGMNVTVVGIVDSNIFKSFKEFDNQPITPWDPRAMGDPEARVDIDNVLILSIDAIKMLKGEDMIRQALLKCLTIRFENNSLTPTASQDISQQFPEFEVYEGYQGMVRSYIYAKKTTIFGWEMQTAPVVLSLILMFNVIIGSVHERRKEILIYNTIGLSPFHIFFMFMAESMIYGIVGGLLGYIGGLALSRTTLFQAVTTPASFTGGWSTTVLGLGIGITLASTFYPALWASRIATPSSQRAWRFFTLPRGSEWDIPLPFRSSSGEDVVGLIAFLHEYLRSHQIEQAELFSVRSISFGEEVTEKGISRRLSFDLRLAPYESGVQQDTQLIFASSEADKWASSLYIKKTSGEDRSWVSSNRAFVDALRKQFLIWTSLRTDQKFAYMDRGKTIVDEAKKQK